MSYWNRVLDKRLTRRRAIAATGATSAAAALLAACGGGDSGDSGPVDKSGLLAKPEDTTKQARRGGILKRSANADPATLDANALSATIAAYLEFVYARLLAFKPGYMEASQDELQADHAESWEISPDKLQITLKLRQGLRFHPLPPVNGRAVDIDDILYSWKRFSTVGAQRSAVANAVNPDAPIISVTAPDARTVVVKLKEPVVYAQQFLAHRESLNILPKEADDTGALDLRNRMLGTGPYYLADYQSSVGLSFKRHEGYWDKEGQRIDQIDYPIVSEYSTAAAQFRAGAIHTYAIRQEDLLPLKREVPELNFYQNPIAVQTARMFFGWQNTAVRDERVRQAMSMSVDRELLIDTLYNVSTFTREGIPVETRWSTALDALETLTEWWVDPKSKDFGPNAKYFQHDVAEAKKLLSAAGYGGGVDIVSNHFTTTQFGADFPKNIEVWEGMMAEAGFRFKKNIMDYSGQYLAIRDTSGKFDGVSYKIGPPAPTGDAVNRLVYEYSTKGGPVGFYGFDAAGKGDGSGDPYVESQLAKAVGEFDEEKRRAIVHDVQRHLGGKQYAMRWAGGATSFALVWPAIQNYRVWRGGTASDNIVAHLTWWLDDQKAPFRRA